VIPIVALAIFMGVLPNVFLHPMEASVNRVIQRITGRQPAQVQVVPAPDRAPGAAAGDGQ
jgi:NADH:ubiquinone oxidoreductase subunit 4 (subunit M)